MNKKIESSDDWKKGRSDLMKEEIDYQKAVAIDPDKLDEEIFSQPGLYMQFSEIYARAERKKEKLKHKLEVLKSKLNYEVRIDPGAFGLSKIKTISNPVVDNAVQHNSEVRKLQEEIIQTNYEVNIIGAAITSLEHKKRMLEKAVDLYNGQYFSPIKAPHAIKGGKRIYRIHIDQEMTRKLNKERDA